LSGQQIVDDGFEGDVGLGSLAINPAGFAKVVEHYVRDDADVGNQAQCNTRQRHGTRHVLDTEGSQPPAPASLMSSQAAAAAAACDEFLQSAHPSDAAREMIAAELLTRCGK